MKKVILISPYIIDIVGYVILELGNDILKMLGVDEPVDDIGVFFRYPFANYLTNALVMLSSCSILMRHSQIWTLVNSNQARQRNKWARIFKL